MKCPSLRLPEWPASLPAPGGPNPACCLVWRRGASRTRGRGSPPLPPALARLREPARSGGLRLRLDGARGVADHELALDAARLVLARRAPHPRLVGLQLPRVRLVRERALERVEEV